MHVEKYSLERMFRKYANTFENIYVRYAWKKQYKV